MMSDSCFAVCVVLTFIAFILTIGFGVGMWFKNWQMESRAVEAGVARYVCDAKDGTTTFEYIKP